MQIFAFKAALALSFFDAVASSRTCPLRPGSFATGASLGASLALDDCEPFDGGLAVPFCPPPLCDSAAPHVFHHSQVSAPHFLQATNSPLPFVFRFHESVVELHDVLTTRGNKPLKRRDAPLGHGGSHAAATSQNLGGCATGALKTHKPKPSMAANMMLDYQLSNL